MTSISINHDRHTSTHWELQDDGTIYESSGGDGQTVSAVDAFKNITTAIVANVKKHSPAHRMTPRCSRVTPITTHSAKAITSPSLSRNKLP